MSKRQLLFIFGTRPEAIKMAPLIKAAQQDSSYEVSVCVTAQHRQMLDSVLSFFNIKPDYDLDLMQPNQDLLDLTSVGLAKLKEVFQSANPEFIFVQGDTTTAFIGALAGFYHKKKVVHIEAGLRSGDKYSPFPEEIYRKLIGQIADYHFPPTKLSAQNLYDDGIKSNVHIVGNTVIDALFLGLDIIKSKGEDIYYEHFHFLDFNKKIILITAHRRESFGKKLEDICEALKFLAEKYKDIQFVYPVHPNPNVQETANKKLANMQNVFLIQPLDYHHMIWLMEKSYIIVTDSGGVQEEAPSLGKPVLVTRDVTERMEGVQAGTAKLVGSDTKVIITEVEKLINNQEHYILMSEAHNPYGDGKSCSRILEILRDEL